MNEAKVEKRGRGRPRKPKVEWRDMEVVMASEDLSKKFESTIEHGLDILERMRQLREEMKSVLETVSQDPLRVNPKVFKSVLKTRNAENQEEAAKQKTDYCNWVFQTQPNAFNLLQTCLKDGL